MVAQFKFKKIDTLEVANVQRHSFMNEKYIKKVKEALRVKIVGNFNIYEKRLQELNPEDKICIYNIREESIDSMNPANTQEMKAVL